MKKIDTVIFDWAGTTVDYGSFAPVEAFVSTFKEAGIEVTMDEVRKPMGMLKRDHIKVMLEMPRINELWMQIYSRSYNENDLDELYMNYENKILSALSEFATPKPFVIETIEYLRSKNIKIGSTTGYNRKMMEIIVPSAKANGYSPDYWCCPDDVGGIGRPYPYMIFDNMKQLKTESVKNVIKVGDTISDIIEGKNAGVVTVGIIEGSSLMGFTADEWEKLSLEVKDEHIKRVNSEYKNVGADYVILNMEYLKQLI